jgi:hypothetical protein
VDTLYVLGEGSTTGTLAAGQLFSGFLTPVNLTNLTAAAPISVSDSAPGQRTRMILADDNTLWLGGIRCTEGQRYATGEPYGCLTMFNISTNTVTMIEPYQGDLTGLAAITGLHKLYIAEGGQVYIYSTSDGSPARPTTWPIWMPSQTATTPFIRRDDGRRHTCSSRCAGDCRPPRRRGTDLRRNTPPHGCP